MVRPIGGSLVHRPSLMINYYSGLYQGSDELHSQLLNNLLMDAQSPKRPDYSHTATKLHTSSGHSESREQETRLVESHYLKSSKYKYL